MALGPDSDLTIANLVITKEQKRRLRALRDLHRTPSRRVTLSEIAREVIDAGLDKITVVGDTVSMANGKEQAA